MPYRHLLSDRTQFWQLDRPFALEFCAGKGGGVLEEVTVAYRTWGQLDSSASNAVVVCHALTGNADVDDWWGPLLGPGRALDPDRDFIVCSNVLGSCYGTTGPTSTNPATGEPYGPDFPAIGIRDMVRLQARLLAALGVQRLSLAIGGSLGGMQVLEWGRLFGDRLDALCPIACSGRHSAWCIGWNEVQRQAIAADPHWQGGRYDRDRPPATGLALARAIAMQTYRSPTSFEQRFGRGRETGGARAGEFSMVSYLQHQGQKLVERFDANTYVTLTRALDAHDLSAGTEDYEAALRAIVCPALVVGIDSDKLYPPAEQEELARHMPAAELVWLQSLHGHDAFLIELDELNERVARFRREVRSRSRPVWQELQS